MSTSDRTEFDEWLKSMVGRLGEFTVLVILADIRERSVTPLCSTYFHIIGDEVDWDEITVMFAGSGQNWKGAAFFPTPRPMPAVRSTIRRHAAASRSWKPRSLRIA